MGMKILFLGEPSSPNTMSWVTGMRSLGCDVVLASVRTNGEDGNSPIGNTGLPPRLRVLTGKSSLKRLIAAVKPDILIAYRITSYGYLASIVGFHPLVLAAQNEQIVYLPTPNALRSITLGFFARQAVKKADLMHAWSDNIASGLIKYGADPQKILTMHRGIDVEKFRFNATEIKDFNINENPVFISTRSLFPEYDIKTVVSAFALVVKQIPNAILRIAGDGPEQDALKKQIYELKIGANVCFLGNIGADELVQMLGTSHIYVSIIQTEGMSSSLLEAVVCGLLPIVADMPASRKIIETGINGYCIKKISVKNVAFQMLDATRKYENIIPALLDNAERIAEDFDRRKNVKAFLEEYKKLITYAS